MKKPILSKWHHEHKHKSEQDVYIRNVWPSNYLKQNSYAYYHHEETISSDSAEYIPFIRFSGIELIEYLKGRSGPFTQKPSFE